MEKKFIEIFPIADNVGVDAVTPLAVTKAKADKLVATGLWAYSPQPKNKNDINLMLDKAKGELKDDLGLSIIQKNPHFAVTLPQIRNLSLHQDLLVIVRFQ